MPIFQARGPAQLERRPGRPTPTPLPPPAPPGARGPPTHLPKPAGCCLPYPAGDPKPAFGSYLTYVSHCRTKHRTEPHVTYIFPWFRAAGSGPLTYLPPCCRRGGVTPAHSHAATEHSAVSGRRMGCGRRRSLRNVSISCCDIAGFSVMTVLLRDVSVEPMRASLRCRASERAVVAPLHCGGRPPAHAYLLTPRA